VVRQRPLALLFLMVLSAGTAAGVDPALRTAAAASQPPSHVGFVSAPDASVLIHGIYPKVDSPCVRPVQPLLHSRFPGTVEVGRDTDGTLFVIGVLPFERYLEGIAEMPRTWPLEALEAQAVAARSYALANLAYPDPTGDRLGYDLCATTACQVYAGMRVSNGPYGGRWRRAVRATAGQVLLYKGRPADTLYFSTSNGSTVGNDQVFGTDPLPYLRPVTENDDGASPLSHWQSRLDLGDVGRFLRAAGDWGGETVSSVSLSGSDVVVKGGGRTGTFLVSDFRSTINYWAPCLAPDHYPPVDAGATLPQTIPSKWFTTSNQGGEVVLTGRGWGHGVGMVQWGAYGKALLGVSYSDILANYYGGLRPEDYQEPSVIKIGIATGLKSVTVEPTGEVTVAGASPGPAPWVVTGGSKLRVRHGGRVPRYISGGRILQAPGRARVGETITVTASVPQLSVASLVFAVHGPDAQFGTAVTVDAGSATVSGAVPNLPPGTYRLQVVLTNGTDIVRSTGRMVRVTGGSLASPSPSRSISAPHTGGFHSPPRALGPSGSKGSNRTVPIALGLLGAILAVALGTVLFVRLRRARPARPGP
jgi:SpoIID/LytB domain protein